MHPTIDFWKFAIVDASAGSGLLFGRVFIATSDAELQKRIEEYFQGTVCEEPVAKAAISELKEGYHFVSDEPRWDCPQYNIRIFDRYNKFVGHLVFLGFEKESVLEALKDVDDADSLFAFVDEVNECFEEMAGYC